MNNITWALCPWFEDSGNDLIHPNDLELVRAFPPYGIVFKVLGVDGSYVKINYKQNSFRVKKHFLTIIKPDESWVYDIGEVIQLRQNGDIAVIEGISWHYKNKQPMYTIGINGKRKSKRYWPKDIKKKE